MNGESRQEKAARIRHLLETEGETVAKNTKGFNTGRYETVANLENYEEKKDQARAIKEDAIGQLPELIDQVTKSVEENGGTVYVAEDAEEANQYIQSVCTSEDAETVVKSKSMTTEELGVNEALEATGIEAVETDLGEWVLQIADEAPSHLVAPALHKSRESIADLFNTTFDLSEPLETSTELTRFARERLWERIRTADIGMTGANFIAADSGTMMLVTSEGNARKTASVPDTHIAVAGVEKLVPSVEDFQPFMELIGRSGTGQDVTSYITMLTPPVKTPPLNFENRPNTPLSEQIGERNFHLVLVDNGRLDMREDSQLRETLYCIRCSACANSCANFQHVGGHAFGGETYTGGIATGWEAGIGGEEAADGFNDLCTGCSRCVNACPVKIDIPWINTVVRDRLNRGADPTTFDHLVDGLSPDEELAGLDLQKRIFGNFSSLAPLGSKTAPLSNWIASNRLTRVILERVAGIDRRRDLPTFERETLHSWFEKRGCQVDPEDADREAVLFADLYTNHVLTERGKAAVRTLESLDVRVEVTRGQESGRAPLSQGMISTAQSEAEAVRDRLIPAIEAGKEVVVIEPSDFAMFEREYEKLLPEDDHQTLANASYEVMEYLYGVINERGDTRVLRDGRDQTVNYHSHCQQRTQGLEGYTVAILEASGYDVTTSDVECCGMAGSFGYKTEYYDLSMDVGRDLEAQFGDDGALLAASGTSCIEQLEDLIPKDVTHPIELVAPL